MILITGFLRLSMAGDQEALVFHAGQVADLSFQLIVTHLSPARYEHLNVFGKYSFPVKEELSRKALRPLRRPGEDE